jgi:hypothetical protein
MMWSDDVVTSCGDVMSSSDDVVAWSGRGLQPTDIT